VAALALETLALPDTDGCELPFAMPVSTKPALKSELPL
jgi:hypothetical protein